LSHRNSSNRTGVVRLNTGNDRVTFPMRRAA